MQSYFLSILQGALLTVGVSLAALALAIGWARPAPWLLAFLLVLILFVVWLFAVSRFIRAHEWGEVEAHE